MSFFSESHSKPKLTEIKLVKRMINEQNSQISLESKTKIFILNFIKKYYYIIIIIIIITISLYWRYWDIKKKRKPIKNGYKEKYKYIEDDESDENSYSITE
jgi:hypothetical protein